MKRSMALVLAVLFAVAPVLAQEAPPTDPNGWVKEIQTADKLLAAGYTDHAQRDYESVIRRYPQNVAGIDKAWLGLARIHMARYAFDQAKASLEEVLKRNSDPGSVTAAKGVYRQLRQEAEAQAQQAAQQLQFLEYRYAMIPFFNVFAKLFTYLDLRKARAAAQAAQDQANGFDPHYFIDDVQASAIRPSYSISGGEFQPAGFETAASGTATPSPAASAAPGVSVHVGAPAGGATVASGTLPAASSAAPSVVAASPVPSAEPGVFSVPALAASLSASPAPTPAASAAASLVLTPGAVPSPAPSPRPTVTDPPASPSPAPATAAASTTNPGAAAAQPDLLTLQRGYQESYRKLQEALTRGNQKAVVDANAEYQKALEAYRAAAAAGRR